MNYKIVDNVADDLPNEETNGKDFQVTLYGKNRANESDRMPRDWIQALLLHENSVSLDTSM